MLHKEHYTIQRILTSIVHIKIQTSCYKNQKDFKIKQREFEKATLLNTESLPYNIGMFQLLEQRNLSDSCAGNALLLAL